MAKNWCKIIELETHDVLVQKSFEENVHSLQISIKDDDIGVVLKATIGVKTESEVNEVYDNFSKENAQAIVNLLDSNC